MKKFAALFSAVALIVSCSGGSGEDNGVEYREFPSLEIPAVIADSGSRTDYSLKHWWDPFFAGTGVTDSAAVLGVRNAGLEQAMANFIGLCSSVPKERGQEAVSNLFSSIEKAQAADTSSHIYLLMTDMVCRYLYDPNSPLRDEDLYLPFLRGMISSRFTREDVMPGYRFEEKMCSLNRYGTQASDFSFKDKNGRVHNLHGIKADYTVLFFSNPGCTACRDIILALRGMRRLPSLISSGRVAVVNIYIDRELDKWREYEKNYPEDWLSGYDYKFIIRDNALYNVRAIPSLYLLDSEKKVMMKDAVTQKVVAFLETIQ